ncbi:hypothetical protein P3T76_007797 [Phytophthora citrophthora]|uniref:Uncharacterized protein n=1 Tax=Phytophthora citrophthora TaxID=4793 RepID=A0AAD9LM75_9STRA|nr:hypothetical protein P3T76_007797 [Phytophthora citrophthora]
MQLMRRLFFGDLTVGSRLYFLTPLYQFSGRRRIIVFSCALLTTALALTMVILVWILSSRIDLLFPKPQDPFMQHGEHSLSKNGGATTKRGKRIVVIQEALPYLPTAMLTSSNAIVQQLHY